jgi:hypothetical protein
MFMRSKTALMDTRYCAFDFSMPVRVDELEGPRLGVRNVKAIQPQTGFPFLIFDPFRNQFQRPPGRGQRGVQLRLGIRLDEGLARTRIILSQREMVARSCIDVEPVFDGFVDHPVERKF